MKGAIFSVVLAAAGGLVNANELFYKRQNFAGEPSCAVGLSTFLVTQQNLFHLALSSPKAQLTEKNMWIEF
jgi:hypothetical protein